MPHSRNASNSPLMKEGRLAPEAAATSGVEGLGMLPHNAIQRGLFRAVTLVVHGRTIRRPVRLPADGLRALLLKL
jgi:hypothetical protein